MRIKIINECLHLAPVVRVTFDTNLRLGDIRKYDCTPNFRHSGVTVQWIESTPGKILDNPLIITVNQLINNTFYTCNATVNNNPANCPPQLAYLSITVKGIISTYIYA